MRGVLIWLRAKMAASRGWCRQCKQPAVLGLFCSYECSERYNSDQAW